MIAKYKLMSLLELNIYKEETYQKIETLKYLASVNEETIWQLYKPALELLFIEP